MRRLVTGLLLLAAAAVLGLVALGGSDTYGLKLTLDDAGGLRDGSPVSIGGVRVGKVELELADNDKVNVELRIERGRRVPKDARVGIAAVNFLGQKQIAFSGGDPSDAAPDGFRIPSSRVTVSTDLDQVLDTLDNDTRTRLAILVNEAGGAVAGRRSDISRSIQELPNTLADGHMLLDQLVTDNRTLGELVETSDRFIAATTAKREDLAELIDTFGQTSVTVEAKRAELAATLAKAPGTLATMRRFFGELERTTVPLGPTARAITATSPALRDTLGRVDSFRRAAEPALDTATAVAPSLTELGTRAAPVVRQARPTTRSLARLVSAAAPLSDTLMGSADNLLATVENWSRAIQLRDGLGHIFRGEASVSPDLLASALDRATGGPTSGDAPARRRRPARGGPATDPAPSTDAAHVAPGPAGGSPLPPVLNGVGRAVQDLATTIDGVRGTTKDTLEGLLGGLQQGPGRGPDASSPGADTSQSLLDFLLGP